MIDFARADFLSSNIDTVVGLRKKLILNAKGVAVKVLGVGKWQWERPAGNCEDSKCEALKREFDIWVSGCGSVLLKNSRH